MFRAFILDANNGMHDAMAPLSLLLFQLIAWIISIVDMTPLISFDSVIKLLDKNCDYHFRVDNTYDWNLFRSRRKYFLRSHHYYIDGALNVSYINIGAST